MFYYQHPLHRLKTFPYKPHFYRAQSRQSWDHCSSEWSNNNIRRFSTHCLYKGILDIVKSCNSFSQAVNAKLANNNIPIFFIIV